MTNNTGGINAEIKVYGQKLETVTSSFITDEGSKVEILPRTAQTTAALTRLKPVWNDRSIPLSSKIRLMRPLSSPSSCMLANNGPSQQNSKEEYKPWKWGATARCYASHTKTMLPIRKSVPRQAVRLNGDLLTIVKRRNLQWYGHVSRSSGLAKSSCKAQ